MADTITFRPDEDASKALVVSTKDGTSGSSTGVLRAALIDAARRKAAAAIRAEAESLADDEEDRAEAMQVLRDMETLACVVKSFGCTPCWGFAVANNPASKKIRSPVRHQSPLSTWLVAPDIHLRSGRELRRKSKSVARIHECLPSRRSGRPGPARQARRIPQLRRDAAR